MKFIFEVKVKPGCTAEQYIAAWQKGSSIIQQQPGARGTKLHKKLGEEDAFIAIATWETKEARDKGMATLKLVDQETRSILDAHTLYGNISVIGNFDDPEWEINPPPTI